MLDHNVVEVGRGCRRRGLACCSTARGCWGRRCRAPCAAAVRVAGAPERWRRRRGGGGGRRGSGGGGSPVWPVGPACVSLGGTPGSQAGQGRQARLHLAVGRGVAHRRDVYLGENGGQVEVDQGTGLCLGGREGLRGAGLGHHHGGGGVAGDGYVGRGVGGVGVCLALGPPAALGRRAGVEGVVVGHGGHEVVGGHGVAHGVPWGGEGGQGPPALQNGGIEGPVGHGGGGPLARRLLLARGLL